MKTHCTESGLCKHNKESVSKVIPIESKIPPVNILLVDLTVKCFRFKTQSVW